jgi:hypothetical protein
VRAAVIFMPTVLSSKKDGSWDGKTRRICVNARLFDGFEAADWLVTVIDGKNLW